jgi:hypothetical protein
VLSVNHTLSSLYIKQFEVRIKRQQSTFLPSAMLGCPTFPSLFQHTAVGRVGHPLCPGGSPGAREAGHIATHCHVPVRSAPNLRSFW